MEGLRRLSAVAAVAVLAAAAAPGWTVAGGAEFGDPDYPLRVAWIGGEIRVLVQPRPNEGYIQIAERVMADPSRYREVIAYNGKRPTRLGQPVAFPLNAVKPRMRGHALRALHPGDTWGQRGWVHLVSDPAENLIQLSEAFTGSKRRFQALARYNGLKNPDLLRIGMEISVPVAWIPDELELHPMGVKAPLRLERDERTGRHYALYRLRRDETLYSSVILRFTGRERAGEVRRLAGQLMRLNAIASPERVPTHRPLRIPIEWISDEYLPDGPPGASLRRANPPPRKRSPAGRCTSSSIRATAGSMRAPPTAAGARAI